MQLAAWALQWVACYVLLVALGLDLDMGAAAAVLFAVNVTAVLPLTPSNLGVFQAACLAVLTGAYGVDAAQALGYGIILQAVEIATAVSWALPRSSRRACPGARCACARSTPRPSRSARCRARPRPDPKLAALAANGSLTWTHALPADSPAVNMAGSGRCLSTDQAA